MWRRFRPPLVLIALALLALLGVLGALQYRWLGQISAAERAQRHSTLTTGAQEFAQDFDREIVRAYLLFQGEPPLSGDLSDASARFAARYDHWQANSRFPRLVKEFYSFSQREGEPAELRRFDASTRRLEPAAWPPAMASWQERLAPTTLQETDAARTVYFVRRIPPPIWESVPAIVVPSPTFVATGRPTMVFSHGQPGGGTAKLPQALAQLEMMPLLGYTLLVIDLDYAANELLPALARRHFAQPAADGTETMDFKVAVVRREPGAAPVFQSTPSFAPSADGPADATAGLFQVRTQDFTTLASEVRRFTAFASALHGDRSAGDASGRGTTSRPMSIVIQQSVTGEGARAGAVVRTASTPATPLWTLVVAHNAGSLEASVDAARRRNLLISFSVLGVLGASIGLLLLSTRRAQRLASQQMEFVATVSHELRTPLAVIRSAAENLADGVVDDQDRIRRYGELMRTEGRRLSEMVEQILEFAGIQSGQRGFTLRPVSLAPLIQDILASSAALIEDAGIGVELDLPAGLPAALGDEPALRRVFQNLIDNAVKYGASGGWMRIAARVSGSDLFVTVADRGIGIDPAEQSRIFEPFYRAADVVAAQVQGAGLGLSLVQRIVAAHGGQVSVKSTPRSGAEFSVRLPIASGAPVAASAASAPEGSGAVIAPEAPRYS